jgi:ribosomal protein L37E
MKKAIQNFNAHKKSAENRGIDFNLTFDEWYNWWLNNGLDRNISQGKRNKDTLCMCRYGDIGPYSLDNIYCATAGQNSKDMTTRYSIKRKIKTPQGIFDSLTDWSKVAGVFPSAFYNLRNKHPNNYNYIDCRANKPDLN